MMEVFEALPEGTNIQLIENNLVISPTRITTHQLLLMEISSQLHVFCKKNKLGKVIIAPYNVYLDKRNAYQPDICFISTENLDHIKKNGLYGVPDLIIEILLPATAKYDKGEKKNIYERSGVKEYWIVDPENYSCVCYKLIEEKFQEVFQGFGMLESELLGCKIEF